MISSNSKEALLKLCKSELKCLSLIMQNKGVVIDGRAGSGKTETALKMIPFFVDLNYNVVVLAPTGLCNYELVQRMGGNVGATNYTIENFCYNFEAIVSKELSGKVLFIIDEVTLISRELFNMFTGLIRDLEYKCLFVGDSFKESGEFDLISVLMNESVALHMCQRSGVNDLVAQIVDNKFDLNETAKVVRVHSDIDAKIQICLVVESLRKQNISDVLILAESNEEAGRLNDFAAVIFNKGERLNGWAVGDRIIFTKNNYQLGYYTGFLGIVLSIMVSSMRIKVLDCELVLPNYLYCDIQYFYATTIHKCQGYMVDGIIAVVKSNIRNNLLYSAVTRSKKNSYVIIYD